MTIQETGTALTFDAALGEVVHVRLRRAGVHQRVLAEYIGMTQASVSNKLRGTRPWSLTDLSKVSEFLNVKASVLIAEAEALVVRPKGFEPLTFWSGVCAGQRVCPFCGLPLDGHDWTCTSADAYTLAA